MTPEKTQIANLIKLAKTNGELSQAEVMLVYGIAHKNGVTRDEMDFIIDNLDDIPTEVPEEENERIQFFYQLLMLGASDFEINDDEVALLEKVGKEFHLDANKVRKAIDYAVVHQKTDLDDEATANLID